MAFSFTALVSRYFYLQIHYSLSKIVRIRSSLQQMSIKTVTVVDGWPLLVRFKVNEWSLLNKLDCTLLKTSYCRTLLQCFQLFRLTATFKTNTIWQYSFDIVDYFETQKMARKPNFDGPPVGKHCVRKIPLLT